VGICEVGREHCRQLERHDRFVGLTELRQANAGQAQRSGVLRLLAQERLTLGCGVGKAPRLHQLHHGLEVHWFSVSDCWRL
jgi:hypothetical protein